MPCPTRFRECLGRLSAVGDETAALCYNALQPVCGGSHDDDQDTTFTMQAKSLPVLHQTTFQRMGTESPMSWASVDNAAFSKDAGGTFVVLLLDGGRRPFVFRKTLRVSVVEPHRAVVVVDDGAVEHLTAGEFCALVPNDGAMIPYWSPSSHLTRLSLGKLDVKRQGLAATPTLPELQREEGGFPRISGGAALDGQVRLMLALLWLGIQGRTCYWDRRMVRRAMGVFHVDTRKRLALRSAAAGEQGEPEPIPPAESSDPGEAASESDPGGSSSSGTCRLDPSQAGTSGSGAPKSVSEPSSEPDPTDQGDSAKSDPTDQDSAKSDSVDPGHMVVDQADPAPVDQDPAPIQDPAPVVADQADPAPVVADQADDPDPPTTPPPGALEQELSHLRASCSVALRRSMGAMEVARLHKLVPHDHVFHRHHFTSTLGKPYVRVQRDTPLPGWRREIRVTQPGRKRIQRNVYYILPSGRGGEIVIRSSKDGNKFVRYLNLLRRGEEREEPPRKKARPTPRLQL